MYGKRVYFDFFFFNRVYVFSDDEDEFKRIVRSVKDKR